MKEFKIIIESYEEYRFDCDYCEMYSNCTQSFKECRRYNSDAWKLIDKQVRKIREKIFKKIILKDLTCPIDD